MKSCSRKKTLLLCVPAYYRGVPEDLVMVEKNPTLVIDCHEESCGSFLLTQMGLLPAARLLLPELREHWGCNRDRTGRPWTFRVRNWCKRLSQEMAELAGGLLHDPDYFFEPQKVQVPLKAK